MRPWLLASVALCAALGLVSPASAQESTRRELRESALRLDQIREERERLQLEMQQLRSRVRDVSSELTNIERQVAYSNEVLQELNFQAATVEESVANVAAELTRSRAELRSRTQRLNRRLRAIYKQGALHSLRVLLSAQSVGELLNRYKYLQLVALHDRALIQDVTRLERELVGQELELREQMAILDGLREEKLGEVEQLQRLETQHEQTLRNYQSRQRQAEGRLEQLERDAARLTTLIADLERRRVEEERRAAIAGQPVGGGAIGTRDLGALNWPVDGSLIYRFGPQRRPNGVVLRWNGIGIGAPAGTPVRAVEEGTVALAGPFEGYGPSVMISHGGGYYTLYLYLQSLAVAEGDRIAGGQVLGTVGGERTPEGPHIEFQVRAPVNGAPIAVDPLSWLRARSGR
ncbi:MAG: murein hydrolase activator EnvC family protein [Longimicrobiales bacterium]